MSTTTIGLVSLFAGIICCFAAKEPANSSIGYKVPFKREKRGWQLGNSLMGRFLITGGAIYLVFAFILRITDNIGNTDLDIIRYLDLIFRIYIIVSMIITEIYILRVKKKQSK